MITAGTALLIFGSIILGIGVILLLTVYLIKLSKELRKGDLAREHARSVPDPADTFKAITELWKQLGWEWAVPIILIIVGLFLVIAGTLILIGSS